VKYIHYKWVSNSIIVLNPIPESDKAREFTYLEVNEFPMERVLSVPWDVEEDFIRYKITPTSCDATRRKALSVISLVYDPLLSSGQP
jgi:hypothetical protein